MRRSGNADGAKGPCVQKETSGMNGREERMDCEVPRKVQLLRWRKGVRMAACSLRTASQGQCETESARRKGDDHDKRGWRKPVVSHGKPDARNPHVRFEEGAGVPCGDTDATRFCNCLKFC